MFRQKGSPSPGNAEVEDLHLRRGLRKLRENAQAQEVRGQTVPGSGTLVLDLTEVFERVGAFTGSEAEHRWLQIAPAVQHDDRSDCPRVSPMPHPVWVWRWWSA